MRAWRDPGGEVWGDVVTLPLAVQPMHTELISLSAWLQGVSTASAHPLPCFCPLLADSSRKSRADEAVISEPTVHHHTAQDGVPPVSIPGQEHYPCPAAAAVG